MTVILSYIFYFVAATASPLQRRWLSTRQNLTHEGQLDFAFKVSVIVAFLSLSLPFIKPFQMTGNLTTITMLALICGLFGSLYWSSLYTAQRHVEAGATTLIMNVYTPVNILLAYAFLNEKLTLLQLAGSILLITGAVIVSAKGGISRLKVNKYFLMVLFSGVSLGFLLTAERTLLKITGFTAGTMISWWTQAVFLGITAILLHSHCNYPKKDILITGGLRFLQSLSWVTLLVVVGNLSLVSSITTFKVVIIFVAAAIFLKERDNIPRKVAGSLLALAGLFLIK